MAAPLALVAALETVAPNSATAAATQTTVPAGASPTTAAAESLPR